MSRGARATAMMVLSLSALACAPSPAPRAPPAPSGPGLVFSYPADGQLDVPTGAPVVLHFAGSPVAVFAPDCALFCVEGPDGVVPGTVASVGVDSVRFEATGGFAEGTTYRVRARPALLPAATNLTADVALSFTTRQNRPQPGVAPVALTFNDMRLQGGGRTVPVLDASTLRVVLSEPVDRTTVSTATVRLTAAGSPVDAVVTGGGQHVVLDPVADLTAGVEHTLTLDGVRDLGGELLVALSITFTPVRGGPPGQGLLRQSLALVPAWAGTNPASALDGSLINSTRAVSPLIGDNVLGLLPGGLDAELGDPSAFGGPIPLVLRKGQRLNLTPLDIRFGGALPSGYQTQTLHFSVLNDAVGFLVRNPFRPAEQLPDPGAPVFIDLTMDTVLTADDPQGNAMATQTLMGLRLVGLSAVDGNQLAVEQVGALDFGTLGVNVARTTLALRLRTGEAHEPNPAPPPRLTAAIPSDGAIDVPPDRPIALVASSPIRLEGASLALTENGVAVPFAARVEGSVVIVTPSRRLVDHSAIVLTVAGLTSLTGQPLDTSATDALKGTGRLAFTVTELAPSNVPPMLGSVTVGAPCALVRASASASGACAGGQSTDPSYAPFSLASNRELKVLFTQSMRVSSFTLGAACGQGAIRVEALSAAGSCTAAVPGTVFPDDRGFRFVPAAPWKSGARYRLVLVAGGNDTCDANELCSRGGVPLNTDPLAGLGAAGGPDVVLPFIANGISPDSLQPLESQPFTDANGNGEIDAVETYYPENHVAMEVSGTSGLITDASLNGPDCMPSRAGQQACKALRTQLPVEVGGVVAHCPIDAAGAATTSGSPCLEVHVLPNLIFVTSLSMNATAIGFLPFNDLATHQLVMRVREPGGVAKGYILDVPGEPYPQFVIRQSIYLDAPDLVIAAGLVSHDLHSKPLEVVLRGPVTFFPDGRMSVALANLADVALSVRVQALASGTIDLRIPQGEMRITLMGPPLR